MRITIFPFELAHEGVRFTHLARINRTLFFETSISNRKEAVLEAKPVVCGEFRKTILFSNRMFLGSTGKVPNGALA
jgi:hypothetical protein